MVGCTTVTHTHTQTETGKMTSLTVTHCYKVQQCITLTHPIDDSMHHTFSKQSIACSLVFS